MYLYFNCLHIFKFALIAAELITIWGKQGTHPGGQSGYSSFDKWLNLGDKFGPFIFVYCAAPKCEKKAK